MKKFFLGLVVVVFLVGLALMRRHSSEPNHAEPVASVAPSNTLPVAAPVAAAPVAPVTASLAHRSDPVYPGSLYVIRPDVIQSAELTPREAAAVEELCQSTLTTVTRRLAATAEFVPNAANVRVIETALAPAVAAEIRRSFTDGVAAIVGPERASEPGVEEAVRMLSSDLFYFGEHPLTLRFTSDTPDFTFANVIDYEQTVTAPSPTQAFVTFGGRLGRQMFRDRYGSLAVAALEK